MSSTSTDKAIIVIPNWNGEDSLRACLDSLKNQTFSVSVVVVDNGSVDGSISIIEQEYKWVVLLKQPKNLGFAGGVNVGIRYALEQKYKFIGLFNNDAVADKSWADSLIRAFNTDPYIAITTGLLLSSNGEKIDSTGEQYSIWGLAFPRQRGKATRLAYERGYVLGASGGASIYKSALFEDIGLFDEHFFAYYEDVDISLRAQLSGYTIFYEPEAFAKHEQGATSRKIPGFTVYQLCKNLPLLQVKDVPLKLLFLTVPRFLLAYILIVLNAVRHGNGFFAVKGLMNSISLTPYALYARKGIQKKRRVSTKYIWSMFSSDLPPDQTGVRKFRRFFTGRP